ncbi:helix-turn-helix domain-containing protein [Streptococcus massiliensis]|uniref:Leucine-rich protein n=1 Tax=Streptococcus massiliensis TaxID=313439 RepID=A0A380KQZ5_9STRE|nr:helix-turn-helix domain-containing protein [Streptococcus massiliensis]SUN72173.1 leucine-rich protein [Streptococcus massiliensis]
MDFLPNLIADFALDENMYVFVLRQNPYMEVLSGLSEMLPVLEFDIGVRLNVALGQVWPQELEAEWSQLFRAEWELFVQTINSTEQSACKSFSQMIHENIGRNQSVSALFLTRLARTIRQFDQMEETILILWDEGAVLTKVAQKLYIHRNTLQYRLEKFYEQTGLNLKNMDDLALCRLALLS